MSERISREDLVKIYNIEITFFDELVDNGLLNVETENNVRYLMYHDLHIFERFANWHYDLEINLPGLEVIHHMLQKMDELSHKNRNLMNKLSAISGKYEDI
ncbi:chaperone modulator CbpM [Chryseobacterium wangxinyae]|uniref:chaperone modulator CbpM n=1 Tax=Chryseobacterium sp. CY353 TaxID=2997334 RepID=UPI002271670A|nr:chaperone modulator CbpM [Chryseobacterium sp. CY353]MCY0969382.1 MerR family transcriptional regulator [Chryseobacterium sp. CY353]